MTGYSASAEVADRVISEHIESFPVGIDARP
jgi:hypothetical protein